MSFPTFILLLDLTAFLWGALWGSFLNVVIYRLPAGLSIVHPPSHCPKCKTQLAWYDNVPILGWIWLRGKCRTCKLPISPRYPIVELLTALLALAIWVHVAHGRFGVDPSQIPFLALGMTFCLYFYFVAILICIALIDLDETIIPHELTGLGTALGLLAAFVIPREGPMQGLWPPVDWIDALIGMVAGSGFIAALILGYKYIRGRDGMGWGDFTLMGLCGVWTGWQGVLFILFAASVQGLIATLLYTLWCRLRGKDPRGDRFLIKDIEALDAEDYGGGAEKTDEPDEPTNHEGETEEEEDEPGFGQLAVPFGPFLSLAAVEYLLLGHHIVPWVLGM